MYLDKVENTQFTLIRVNAEDKIESGIVSVYQSPLTPTQLAGGRERELLAGYD